MPLAWLKKRLWRKDSPTASAFNVYVSSTPSLQNAVDAVVGWNVSFPPQFALKAGALAAYNDPRIGAGMFRAA